MIMRFSDLGLLPDDSMRYDAHPVQAEHPCVLEGGRTAATDCTETPPPLRCCTLDADAHVTQAGLSPPPSSRQCLASVEIEDSPSQWYLWAVIMPLAPLKALILDAHRSSLVTE
jgi:hypothetical protein